MNVLRNIARVLIVAGAAVGSASNGVAQNCCKRPVVGVALGGGSAKGFAHVGVIRWFEEHRIPIDRIAGTSMGGLIAGAYAAGMSPAELDSLLVSTNWDEVFGASRYSFLSVARKEDARAYPSWFEFHMRGGLTLPISLNRGQQVDLLIERIAGLYTDVRSFDALPTPFRTTAVDLRTGSLIVLRDGPLATAMRATMSLPGVFPPVHFRNYALVDGGAMNNLPADIVKGMGSDVVIAVSVNSPDDTADVARGVFGITNQTVNAMMRANTRRAAAQANIVLNADAESLGSNDWRRARELIDAGYDAAEAMKGKLLKYAVSERAWQQYQSQRMSRRRVDAPTVTKLVVNGATPEDERRIRRRLAAHVARPLDVALLEHDITRLGGLDRYTSFRWGVARESGGSTLIIDAVPLRNAPPFLMTAVNVRNQASDEYTFQLGLRYLDYDVLMRGSQLRVDLALGTDRHVGFELRQSLGGTPLFAAVRGAYERARVDFWESDDIIAQYGEKRLFGQLDLGYEFSSDAEARVGIRGGYYEGEVQIGNPVLPDIEGGVWELRSTTIVDKQNSPVVPSRGLRLVGNARYVLSAPEVDDVVIEGSSDGLTQLEMTASHFWSWRNASRRVFVAAAGGTSFEGDPLPTDQFTLGLPFRLDAFAIGERRGDHYATLTLGHLRAIGRLPDFLGGPVLAGVWLENGSAFNDFDTAEYEIQLGLGVIAETLVGPFWIGYALGNSARGFSIGIGRLFP